MALLNFDELIPKQTDKLDFESLIPKQKGDLDFESLIPQQPKSRAGEEFELPPLQGTPAPGVPLPPERELPVPLPTPRPADLGQGTSALDPMTAALVGQTPSSAQPGIAFGGGPKQEDLEKIDLSKIPGALELKQRIDEQNVAATLKRAPIIDQQRAEMQRLVDEGKLSQASLDYFNKLHPADAYEQAEAKAKASTEAVEAQPKTEFDKNWASATTVSDMAKAIGNDITGAVKSLAVKPTVEFAPEAAAAVGGAEAFVPVTMLGTFLDSIKNAIVSRGGDINKPGQFQKIYNANENEINKEAGEQSAIAGAGGAAMGALPGGTGLKDILTRVFIGYPALNQAQRLAEREVQMKPVVDANGNPVTGPDGKVVMQPAYRQPGQLPIIGTEPMTGKEMLQSYIQSLFQAPFMEAGTAGRRISEAGKLGEAPKAPGAEPPKGGEAPQGPEVPPSGPSAPSVNDEATIFSSFKEDIESGRKTREQVLDQIAKMSPDEIAQQADLTRRIGGAEFEAKPLSEKDQSYLDSKRSEAPAAQPSPEKPVEAPGEAAPVPPSEAPTYKVPLEDAAILKGAGYDADMISEMSARERKRHLKEAKENQVQPAELTDEDKATLTIEKPAPAPAPAEAAPAPAEAPAPSTVAVEKVAEGVPPLEAMEEAAAPAPAPEVAPASAPAAGEQWAEMPVEMAPPKAAPAPAPEAASKAPEPTPAAAPEAAPPAKAPELENVEGHSYGSMKPKRFTSMMNEAPIFRWDAKGKSPAEAGNDAIKFRIDQSAVPNGGDLEDAVAKMPSAVKEVIVGENAYKGLNQKEITNLNNALAKVENAGGKITMIGEPPTIAKGQRKAKPAAEGAKPITLYSLARKVGGIKETKGELKARDIGFPVVNNKKGIPIEQFVERAIDAGYYPEYEDQPINQEMINRVLDDLMNKRDFRSDEQKRAAGEADRKAEEEHYRALEDERRINGYEDEIRNVLADMGHTGSPELVRDAAELAYKHDMSLHDAIESAASGHLARELGDSGSVEDITGTDFWDTVHQHFINKEEEAPSEARPSPEPEAGATRGEERQPVAKPEEKAKVEEPSKPVPEAGGKEISKPVEAAQEPFKGDSLAQWHESPNQFDYTPDMPIEYFNVMRDWAKMLGIKGKIILTTEKERENFNFYPYKIVTKKSRGYNIPFPDGNFMISIRLHPNKIINLETIAHELGHAFEKETWEKASFLEKKAVMDDYNKWLESTKKMDMDQLYESIYPWTLAKKLIPGGGYGVEQSKYPEQSEYVKRFTEYFANQVARYMMSERKPQSIVGKFFARIAERLRSLYNSLAGMSGKAAKSMKDYIDRRINPEDSILGFNDAKGFEPAVETIIEPYEMRTSFSKKNIDEINEMNRKNGMEPSKEEPSTIPKETMRGKLARLFQDEFDYLRRIQEWIEKSAAAPLPESTDAYASVNLLPGRLSEATADMQRDEVDPILNELKQENITPEDFGWFLVARHAKERNAMMAKRDPKRFGEDGGSGMANKTADEVLKRYDNRRDVFERIAQKVYDMLDRDLDRRVEAGLMSEEEAQGYKDQYEYYVPLTGFAEMDAAEQERMQYNLGKGVSVTKKESPAAMGRITLANNPLLSSILKVQEGIYRAEKNRAAKALLALAKANPNPELWEVNKPKLHKEIGPDGMVKWVVDGMVGENTVIAKVGGIPYYITLKHPGLAEAYKKIGVVRMNPVMRMIGNLTRFFSQLQTTRSPAFIFPNIARDTQEAISNAQITDPEIAKRIPGFMPKAFNIAQKAVRGKLNIKNLDKMSEDEIQKLIDDGVATKEDIEHQLIYDEWRRRGGKISWHLPSGMEERAKELQNLVGNLEPSTWKYLPKATLKRVNNLVKYFWNGLEKIGSPAEDMTRMSVFMAARDVPLLDEKGNPVLDNEGKVVPKYSIQQAARFAQDFVVNFYRKGQWTPITNALFAFSNAAFQGDVYFGRKLFFTPEGRKFLAKFMAFSAALSLWNFMMSDDDEMEPGRKNYMNIPDSEKSNSFIFKYGKGPKDYIRIPSIPIFSSLKDFMDQAVSVALKQQGIGSALTKWVGNTWDAHNPTSSNSLWSSLVPTIVRPFYDIHENTSYSGIPIHPKEEPWNQGVPHYEQPFANTSPAASMFTKFLYNATRGGVDIYPSDAEYITKSYLGGLGRTSGNIFSALNDLMHGKSVDLKNVPILSRFVPTGWDESGRYYDLHQKVDAKINQARVDKQPYNSNLVSALRDTDSRLKKYRQQIIDNRDNDKISATEKEANELRMKNEMKQIFINMGKRMVQYLNPPK